MEAFSTSRSTRSPDRIDSPTDVNGSPLIESHALSVRSARSTSSKRAQEDRSKWWQGRLYAARVFESHTYEVILAAIVLGNACIIVQEVDTRAIDGDTTGLKAVQTVFFSFYVVELLSRIWVYRRGFFCSKWNSLDFAIVLLDGGSTLVSGVFVSTLPSLSILRVLRLARLVRVIRILTAVKELQMLLHSFFSTVRTLFWASFMLLVLLSLWSIIAVEMLHPVNTRVFAAGLYEDCERCERAFRSVMESNLTFMQTIIAGDAWGVLAVPIIEEAPWTSVIFVVSFISINLGVLNLVLTVIVNAAQEEYERQRKRLLKILGTLDDDKNGFLSMVEMQKAVQTNAEFRTVLEAIDVRKDDVEEFFLFLASDSETGEVTYRDFVDQVFKMKSGDTIGLIRSVKTSLSKILMTVRKSRELLERSQKAADDVGQELVPCPSGQEMEPCAAYKIQNSQQPTQVASTRTGSEWSTSIQMSAQNNVQRFGAVPEGPGVESTHSGLEESLRGKWQVLPGDSKFGSVVVAEAMQSVRLAVDRLHQRLHVDLMGVIGEMAARLKEDLAAVGQDTSQIDALVDRRLMLRAAGELIECSGTMKQSPETSHQSAKLFAAQGGESKHYPTNVRADAGTCAAGLSTGDHCDDNVLMGTIPL